jgi:hypothetical protein
VLKESEASAFSICAFSFVVGQSNVGVYAAFINSLIGSSENIGVSSLILAVTSLDTNMKDKKNVATNNL